MLEESASPYHGMCIFARLNDIHYDTADRDALAGRWWSLTQDFHRDVTISHHGVAAGESPEPSMLVI